MGLGLGGGDLGRRGEGREECGVGSLLRGEGLAWLGVRGRGRGRGRVEVEVGARVGVRVGVRVRVRVRVRVKVGVRARVKVKVGVREGRGALAYEQRRSVLGSEPGQCLTCVVHQRHRGRQ